MAWRDVDLFNMLHNCRYCLLVGCGASTVDAEDRGRLWPIYPKRARNVCPVRVSGESFLNRSPSFIPCVHSDQVPYFSRDTEALSAVGRSWKRNPLLYEFP